MVGSPAEAGSVVEGARPAVVVMEAPASRPLPAYSSGRVGNVGTNNSYVWIVLSYADIAAGGAGTLCQAAFTAAGAGWVGVGVCGFVGWQAQTWFNGTRAGNHGVYFDIGIGWNNAGRVLRSGRW